MLNAQPKTSIEIARRRSRGFSFAEVMFAVVILGIGFIMVAAIFPVAIQQTQQTSTDSTAASLAREAAAATSQIPTSSIDIRYNTVLRPNEPATMQMFPATEKAFTPPVGGGSLPSVVEPFGGARWDAIKSSLILSSDPRVGYVPFYRRDNGSNVAQLIIVAVQCQNQSIYTLANDTTYPTPTTLTMPTFTASGNSAATAGMVYPAQVQLAGGTARPGDCITATYTVSAAPAISETRTYRLGRLLNAGYTLFELETPDDLRRDAGADGIWGTVDDITDLTPSALPITSTSVVYNATLQPVMAYAELTFPSGSLYGRIQLFDTIPLAGALVPPNAAATGAYVVIADDFPYDSTTYNPATPSAAGLNYAQPATAALVLPTYTSSTVNVGQSNGKIYRLGAPVSGSPGVYELDPTTPMRAPTGGSPSVDQLPANQPAAPGVYGALAKVYLVGVGHSVPTTPNSNYTGPAQAVAAYTTFFSAK